MLLWTAHGRDGMPDGYYNVADASGLTDYLGYRPMFCSFVDSDSLVDTWFRIANASASFVEVVDVYDVDESLAVLSDVVEWVNVGFDEKDWPMSEDALERVLVKGDKLSTDWLLPPDTKPTWRFDVWDMVRGNVEDMCSDAKTAGALRETMAKMRVMMRTAQMSVTDGREMDLNRMSLENWYMVLTKTGFVPYVWSVVCGREIPTELVAMDPEWLVNNTPFQIYQQLLVAWDSSMSEQWEFGRKAFDVMYDKFSAATDILAHKIAEDTAKVHHVGRNGECYCGSGRKFKKCCARKGLDELVRC